VTIEVAGDVTLRADPYRLMQVISNLVANALRYARDGRDVLVRAGTASVAVFLEVHKEGEPMSGHSCSGFLESFQREDAAEPSRGHLGLGLFIVHEIVRAHGGTVSVESNEVHGTTFRVVLPRTGAL